MNGKGFFDVVETSNLSSNASNQNFEEKSSNASSWDSQNFSKNIILQELKSVHK